MAAVFVLLKQKSSDDDVIWIESNDIFAWETQNNHFLAIWILNFESFLEF